MYAVIQTGGKQYKVLSGDVIRVEKLNAAPGDSVTFDQVLMIGGEETLIGTPTLKEAKVTGTVIDNGKADKLTIYKYKRKSGYHKKSGHRQSYTEIKIDSVTK